MLISRGTRFRRYEVTEPLGAGGMGEVYLARDVELDRIVALKVLIDAPDEDGERNRRFIQEARAAISLNHPNVAHVYDAGEEHGIRFMAMEHVEGETLRERMSREPLTLAEALEIAVQTASALASAHGLGIVHRDVKPENVMIRPDGYVKVLDFGLAKLTPRGGDGTPTLVVHTAPGTVMGTMQYMSPEQLRTDDVDARSDVFSLGVVLYEMLSSKRPFDGSSPSGVIASILTDDPPPLDGALPPSVRAIVMKALAKKRDERYASAGEMAAALKSARDETKRIRSGDLPTQAVTHLITPPPRRLPWQGVLAALLVIALILAGVWYVHRRQVIRDARAQLPQLEKLAEDRQFFAAWDLASTISAKTGPDERVARALEKISAAIDVKSEPAGAQVFLERVNADGTTGPRTLAGTTPLAKHAVPLGDYILRIEKSGFAPMFRTVSLTPIPVDRFWVPAPPVTLDLKLLPANEAPPRMVRVKGASGYRVAAWGRPTDDRAELDDFFIDQFEVTNREFKEFIDAGGYERHELWKTLPDGAPLAEFKDATGLPAPRRWVNQAYPEGRDDYPVTDVSWHEAAAYAEFRGKSLPTLFQWDKAARDGNNSVLGTWYPWGLVPSGVTDVAHRANFRGAGTMPVTSLPSGMSAYGAYHLAGNVSEWCRNAYGDGVVVTGGDYNSPTYGFGQFGSVPPAYSASTIGFRCVRAAGKSSGDQGAGPISFNAMKVELHPAGDAEFAKIARFYDYAPTPLNAKVVERREAESWTLETIEYDGASSRATAYLYLPKHASPPYQVVHYVPAGDVANGIRTLEASTETMMAAYMRGGRAVFGVVLRGYLGRVTGDLRSLDVSSEEYADRMLERVTDLRRGLDYLASRPDIDKARIGYYGPSAGGSIGVIVAALETRYAAVGLMGIGVSRESALRLHPKANQVNFAPRIRAPKLIMHGRWDEASPLQSQGVPLYDLMPEPKRFVVVDGGHVPPMEIVRRTYIGFFDEQFGKPRR